jgi:uncharacterized membrane protein YedE/YeeE
MLSDLVQLVRGPWPWWIGGIAIGAMVPLLLFLANRQFGVSSTLRHICAACLPSGPSFFRYEWRKDAWNLFLVAGVAIGGGLAQRYLIASPDAPMPLELFSFDALGTPRGLLVMVGGGFLVGFGSRWANGCTSGHAIMGLSLRRPASLVAVIGFFIGGLFVTWCVLPKVLP